MSFSSRIIGRVPEHCLILSSQFRVKGSLPALSVFYFRTDALSFFDPKPVKLFFFAFPLFPRNVWAVFLCSSNLTAFFKSPAFLLIPLQKIFF